MAFTGTLPNWIASGGIAMPRRPSVSVFSRVLVLVLVLFLLASASDVRAQHSSLIADDALAALIAETSGELALGHFRDILQYSGYAPAKGSEQTADYIAARAKAYGLEDVHIEEFPSDGQKYFWAFRTEPWWEATRGELSLVDSKGHSTERLASFDVSRIVLARYSRSARVDSELVDVGAGTDAKDYEGKDVKGKIVLASGAAGPAHAQAVWRQGAAGAVVYRMQDHVERPDLIGSAVIEPFESERREPPGFVFSLSYRAGMALAERLHAGEHLRVLADVEAETRAGHYSQVQAVLRGTEPGLPEVWIQAHDNYRNTGGGNNLTGVGATIDLARSLSKLVESGRLPRPRRTVRFTWGPEHMASIYYFHEHPEAVSRILAYLNLDMVGDHQELSESVLRLYRTPYSLPSFVNDVVQEMFEVVGQGNFISISARGFLDFRARFSLPILEPSGSRDPFYYFIEPFWGPSDHEDVGESSLGVPAVLFNTWPDPYIGTQEDTWERADATQMKRAEVIAGASAYVLATAGNGELPALAQNALAKARVRLASEERRAMDLLYRASAESFREDAELASWIVRGAHDREAAAVATLSSFASDEGSQRYVRERAGEIGAALPSAVERLDHHRDLLARTRGWKPSPAQAPKASSATLVPRRTPLLHGPVNFFRPEYGRDWMVEKTSDPEFVEKVRLARRGHYYLYETLNFADGKRNLEEIREAVAAEYGPAPIDEIEQYFRLLERVGIVTVQ
jgi:aminopeptidase YwaD